MWYAAESRGELRGTGASAQVPTKLAVSIKGVPLKLARSIQMLADGDEDKQRKIGEVFPKPSA